MATNEDKLITALKQLLGHSYVMYFRAHSAHWNIEGSQFVTLHGFFGGIYEDVFGSIDRFAEAIRQHSAFAPVNLTTVVALGADQAKATAGGDGTAMLRELQSLNTTMMKHLAFVRSAAEDANDWGLANFTQDREAAHLKLDWQIKSLLK